MVKKKLFVPLSLSKYPPVGDVLVLGCGGTGAFVISHLTRFISTFGNITNGLKSVGVPSLTIADGDIVEEKNLIRQHFISRDIGRNKAEVLAERYTAAFGVEINVIPENIEDVSQFPTLRGESVMIIGCVDNNASRQLVHNTFFVNRTNYGQEVFWIDSGNEETNGQVICGLGLPRYPHYGNILNNRSTETKGLFSLPIVTEVYPEILEESKFNSELSCAERAISAPQNMMTNVTASVIVMNYAQTILSNQPLTSHGVEFGIKNVFTTRFNTRENLSVVDLKRKAEREK